MNNQHHHLFHSRTGHGSRIRRAMLTLTGTLLLLALLAVQASAVLPSFVSHALKGSHLAASEPASPYGETSRFGGFAEGAIPGKFDYPVGFTVDPENHPSKEEEEASKSATKDHNAVYVLDR